MFNLKYFQNERLTRSGFSLLIIVVMGCLLAIRNRELAPIFPASEFLFTGVVCLGGLLAFTAIRIPLRGVFFLHFFLLLCLLLCCILSALSSDNSQLSLQRALSVYFLVLVVILVVFADTRPALTYYNIAVTLMFFGSMAVLYSLTLKTMGNIAYTEKGAVNIVAIFGVEFTQKIYGAGSLRYASFFENPNAFGLWLLFSIINTYYLIRLLKVRNLLLWVTFIVQIYALFSTGSRSAIISTFIGLFFLWTYGTNKKTRIIIFWFSGTLILFFIPFLAILVGNFRGNNEGLSARGEAWSALIGSIKDQPLLGEGFGLSFEEVLIPAGVEFGAHNVYLSLASEIGIIGLIIFLFFWFWGIITMFLCLSKIENGEYRLRIVGALALVLAISFNQFFENSLMRFTFTTTISCYYLTVIVRGLHYGK